MTKEKLLEWGLTEEQATKVMEGLNGSFVTKARFNEVNTELTTAKNTIKERDTQLETLKKSTGDTKALQDQITQLQTDNANQKKAHEAEMKALKIGNAVDMALTGAKAKNNTAVKALLVDFIGKAELAEDGTVKGLDDEVKKLVEGKDTAFLFEKSTGTKFKGAKSAEKGDGAEGGMTLEKLKAMNPLDRYNYSVNHPDEYKELYGGRLPIEIQQEIMNETNHSDFETQIERFSDAFVDFRYIYEDIFKTKDLNLKFWEDFSSAIYKIVPTHIARKGAPLYIDPSIK